MVIYLLTILYQYSPKWNPACSGPAFRRFGQAFRCRTGFVAGAPAIDIKTISRRHDRRYCETTRANQRRASIDFPSTQSCSVFPTCAPFSPFTCRSCLSRCCGFCRDKDDRENGTGMMRNAYIANELNCSARVWPIPLSFICPFAIMCMSSIPPSKMRAHRKVLKPSIGRVRRLIAR